MDLFIKEVSRLLAERSRQRQPERDQAQHRLIEVKQELANITKAITMGIVTATTKTALMNAEAEGTRLQEIITASEEQADKVVMLLPKAKERYWSLIEGIGALSAKHLPQAREQVRALVGEIRLTPTKAGYLEAPVTGRYAGLISLLSGGKLNRDGCGGLQSPTTFNINFCVDLVKR